MTTTETIDHLNSAIVAWQQAPDEPARATAMQQIKSLLGSASPEDAEVVHEIKSLVQILKSLSTVL